MIKAIELENVQNIKHALLEPHPRFNIIIGTSDHGKSAIIRGIKFAIRNDSDIDLLNWDAKRGEGCSVAIEFDDGFIVRYKSKSKNQYTTSITEGPPLEAFRKDIPEDVKIVTRMNDINIKSQDDPYLFFQKSPGEVARMLNKSVGNENIDIFFKRVDKIILDSKRRKATLEETIKENDRKSKELDWVEEANKEIKSIDRRIDQVSKTKDKIKSLEELVNGIEYNEDLSKQYKEWLFVETDFNSIKKQLDALLKMKDKFAELNGMLNRCYTLIENQKQFKITLGAENDVKKIFELIKIIAENKEKRNQIKNAIQTIETLSNKADMLKTRQKKLKIKHDQTLIAIKVCPTCGQSTAGLKGEGK